MVAEGHAAARRAVIRIAVVRAYRVAHARALANLGLDLVRVVALDDVWVLLVFVRVRVPTVVVVQAVLVGHARVVVIRTHGLVLRFGLDDRCRTRKGAIVGDRERTDGARNRDGDERRQFVRFALSVVTRES